MSTPKIPYEVRQAFTEQGIKLDMLGQRLSKGDYVLTKSYGSACHDTLAKIKRVNPVNLVIDVEITGYDREAIDAWRKANPGKQWWDEANHDRFRYHNQFKEMSRKPSDVIKFDQQAAIAKAEYDSLVEAYPECFL